MPIPARSWITVRSTPRCNNFLGKRGFTLVELIMTVVVVSIVAIPLSLLISQHLESVLQSQDHTVAVNLARLEMEKVNNLSYDNVASVPFTPYPGYNYDISRDVVCLQGNCAVGAPGESLKQITVAVRRTGSLQVLVSLVTYLAKSVTYGI